MKDSLLYGDHPVGVVGAGSFGCAIANLLAENAHVLLYERNPEVRQLIRDTRLYRNHTFHERVEIVDTLEEIAGRCFMIFPVVPSASFKSMIWDFSPYLRPDHIMIHATKGLHCEFDVQTASAEQISLKDIKTMSEIILQETGIVRVGCMAGPNLAAELAEYQPAATVIASRFDHVIREGKQALRSNRLIVYGNNDLLGIELAGVLKNYVALGAGMASGFGFGENVKAMLITRGMAEMIYIGHALGADKRAFLGMAGIGDLIATCTSPKSRNFTVGFRLAQGEKLEDVLSSMHEVAEGIRTLQIAKLICDHKKISAPLLQALHKAVFGEMDFQQAIKLLMRIPVTHDAEYLDL